MDPPYGLTLWTHPIITVGLLYSYSIIATLLYGPTLWTHPVDPPYPMDPPCGPTLWTHPMDPPYGPTLHGPTHSSPILVPLCSNSVGKWCG